MTQEKRADLHLHTFYSDGTFSPQEVIRMAREAGLSAISITDHDSIEGLPGALRAASTLEVIPGVEMTAAFKERELHILGYGFRMEDPGFRSFLDRMRLYRIDRIGNMIARLGDHGIHVTLEEVRAIAGEGSVGRPHLAEALVKKGVVRSLEEAFGRYLGDRAPCFVKGATIIVPQAAQIIRKAGGVAILAHPHRMVEDSWLPELMAAGIQGIEVHHPDHDSGAVEKYRRFAQRNQLLMTGGSDCHGLRKLGGPAIGSVAIPYEWVERLKEAARNGQPC